MCALLHKCAYKYRNNAYKCFTIYHFCIHLLIRPYGPVIINSRQYEYSSRVRRAIPKFDPPLYISRRPAICLAVGRMSFSRLHIHALSRCVFITAPGDSARTCRSVAVLVSDVAYPSVPRDQRTTQPGSRKRAIVPSNSLIDVREVSPTPSLLKSTSITAATVMH